MRWSDRAAAVWWRVGAGGRRSLHAASYTIQNLREIEDVAPGFGFDAIQEARFARRALDAHDTGLAYHVIKPRQTGGC